MTWDRPYKNIARQMAEPSKPVAASLWLPGVDILDILNAWDKNLLHKTGTHILVERKAATAEVIIKKLGRKKNYFILERNELQKVTLPGPLDFSHLDFCGGLGSETARWISGLQFNPGAEINFTFAYAVRNNLFLKRCHEIIYNDPRYVPLVSHEYHDLDRQDENIAAYCVMLRCLLRQYSFAELQPVYYRDTVNSMVLYRCKGLHPVRKPTYPDLLAEFRFAVSN